MLITIRIASSDYFFFFFLHKYEFHSILTGDSPIRDRNLRVDIFPFCNHLSYFFLLHKNLLNKIDL
jgi:hypothetical protein